MNALERSVHQMRVAARMLRENGDVTMADILVETSKEVQAERDALREHLTRLIDAAELGLSFAECDLACEQIDFAGYPDKWELTESHVNFIKAAIDAAKGGAE
jgi:hypothetical protein